MSNGARASCSIHHHRQHRQGKGNLVADRLGPPPAGPPRSDILVIGWRLSHSSAGPIGLDGWLRAIQRNTPMPDIADGACSGRRGINQRRRGFTRDSAPGSGQVEQRPSPFAGMIVFFLPESPSPLGRGRPGEGPASTPRAPGNIPRNRCAGWKTAAGDLLGQFMIKLFSALIIFLSLSPYGSRLRVTVMVMVTQPSTPVRTAVNPRQNRRDWKSFGTDVRKLLQT